MKFKYVLSFTKIHDYYNPMTFERTNRHKWVKTVYYTTDICSQFNIWPETQHIRSIAMMLTGVPFWFDILKYFLL